MQIPEKGEFCDMSDKAMELPRIEAGIVSLP